MPGATTPRLVSPPRRSPGTQSHDAPHRAEQTDERRDARRRRQKRDAVLQLVQLDGRRAQQRAVDGIEALQRWTRRRPLPAWRSLGPAAAQLRVQLRVAGLEQTDERARRQRRADGLHFGELAALAEDVEERRRLLLGRRNTQIL